MSSYHHHTQNVTLLGCSPLAHSSPLSGTINLSLLKFWGQTVFLTQVLSTFFPKKKGLEILLSAANRLQICSFPFLSQVCKTKVIVRGGPKSIVRKRFPPVLTCHEWTPGVLRCWALRTQVARGPGAGGVFLGESYNSCVCQDFKRTGKHWCKSSHETSGAWWWW